MFSSLLLPLGGLLLAPLKGLLWAARKIHAAAEEEVKSRRARTRSDLAELYMLLETGQITEQEFDEREKQLLDRLDQLKEAPPPGAPAEDEPAPAEDEPAPAGDQPAPAKVEPG
jgi:hypothetical protein